MAEQIAKFRFLRYNIIKSSIEKSYSIRKWN